MLLGQIRQDVGVENRGVQETAPQRGQLRAEFADVPADLFGHFLVALLQLMMTDYESVWTSDCGALAVKFD